MRLSERGVLPKTRFAHRKEFLTTLEFAFKNIFAKLEFARCLH